MSGEEGRSVNSIPKNRREDKKIQHSEFLQERLKFFSLANGILTGVCGTIPLIVEKFVIKTANAINMISCKCDQNPPKQLLKQFSKLYHLWGMSRDHYWRGGIKEIHDF